DLPAVAGLRPSDLAALGVEVAHDVAKKALRDADLDVLDRLQQHRPGLQGGLPDGHRAGDLEGHVGGVDGVVLAVDQGDLDVDHRVAGHDAFGHGVADAFFDRGPEVLGDGA